MAAQAPPQQLSQVPRHHARRLSPSPQEARNKGNMLGRAFIDSLASLVERRIEAGKDGAGQEKGQVTEGPAVRSKGVGDSKSSQQRQRLIAESEMLEQVAVRD